MGGMGFPILLPCLKYLCAEIIVLSNGGTTIIASCFSPIPWKENSVHPPTMKKQLGKVEWTVGSMRALAFAPVSAN